MSNSVSTFQYHGTSERVPRNMSHRVYGALPPKSTAKTVSSWSLSCSRRPFPVSVALPLRVRSVAPLRGPLFPRSSSSPRFRPGAAATSRGGTIATGVVPVSGRSMPNHPWASRLLLRCLINSIVIFSFRSRSVPYHPIIVDGTRRRQRRLIRRGSKPGDLFVSLISATLSPRPPLPSALDSDWVYSINTARWTFHLIQTLRRNGVTVYLERPLFSVLRNDNTLRRATLEAKPVF